MLLALPFLACGKLDETDSPDGSAGSGGASSGGADSRLVDIECGERHACGIDVAGSIRCWGAEFGEEPPMGRFVKLASGKGYNCALDDTKNLVCWGPGYYPPDSLPSNFALVAPVGRFDEVVLSNDDENLGCAWTVGGALECWRNEAWMPMFAPPSDDVVDVAVGLAVCVRDSVGEVACASAWGPDHDSFNEDFEPVDPALRFVDVGVSGSLPYACGVATDERLHCWGIPGGSRERVETLIGEVLGLVEFETSSGIACAEDSSGRLACAGGVSGYTRDGAFRWISNGFEDPPDPPFVDWCINRDYGCVLREGGTVECWGDVPEEFPNDFVGDFYSCELDGSSGEVNCTGERPEHFGDDYW